MAKRRKKRKHATIIKIGHFYNVHDGSVSGHPAKILNVDYQNQVYLVIITETKSNDGRNIPLIVPTDIFVQKSFLLIYLVILFLPFLHFFVYMVL